MRFLMENDEPITFSRYMRITCSVKVRESGQKGTAAQAQQRDSKHTKHTAQIKSPSRRLEGNSIATAMTPRIQTCG